MFQDGVRLNEPFGDVVNWEVLPESAIDSAQIIPGATPTFGLNALGGVIALRTKSRSHTMLSNEHRITLGLSADRGATQFGFDTEVADLTENRGALGTGRIAAESIVRLRATTATGSAHMADVVAIGPNLTVMVAARVNQTAVDLRDRVADALSGEHRFTNFNPAAGLSFRTTALTVFANINQSARTPTPVELTCANPDDPCRLPNAFVSDPPLRQVTARGIEVGVRGRETPVRWSVALFQSANEDDIIFISSGAQRGSGYFTNVGRTYRGGMEAALDGHFGRFTWSAGYALLQATFGSGFTVFSRHNPEAVDGEIHVTRGDRLPLMPRHRANMTATFRPTARLTLSADARYASSAFFRGDEANLNAPLHSYAVVNFGTSVTITPRVAVELTVTNAANAAYDTFGTFGDPAEVLGEQYDNPRFVSPAEPRRAALTVRLRR